MRCSEDIKEAQPPGDAPCHRWAQADTGSMALVGCGGSLRSVVQIVVTRNVSPEIAGHKSARTQRLWPAMVARFVALFGP